MGLELSTKEKYIGFKNIQNITKSCKMLSAQLETIGKHRKNCKKIVKTVEFAGIS